MLFFTIFCCKTSQRSLSCSVRTVIVCSWKFPKNILHSVMCEGDNTSVVEVDVVELYTFSLSGNVLKNLQMVVLLNGWVLELYSRALAPLYRWARYGRGFVSRQAFCTFVSLGRNLHMQLSHSTKVHEWLPVLGVWRTAAN